ncbi:MAG: hypothetical protein R2738_05325 [Bacteroides graminisolvens]
MFSVLLVLLFVSVAIQAGGTDDVLSRLVKITTTKGGRYRSYLEQVSDQAGYYFIYDSELINNDEEVKVRKENIQSETPYIL